MEESIAYRILIYILCIVILVAIIALSKWRELSKERTLRKLVSWSAIGDYCPSLGRHSYVRDLILAVQNAQYKDTIDKKYRFTEDEKHWATDIIEEYQTDIMRSYFKGQLKLIKSKYVVDGKDYFMLMLYIFLSEHQCDDKFIGHEMYSYATHDLTDFALVFHKMHFITYMYCRDNEILKGLVPEWNEKNLKEILDTKQIQISRY